MDPACRTNIWLLFLRPRRLPSDQVQAKEWLTFLLRRDTLTHLESALRFEASMLPGGGWHPFHPVDTLDSPLRSKASTVPGLGSIMACCCLPFGEWRRQASSGKSREVSRPADCNAVRPVTMCCKGPGGNGAIHGQSDVLLWWWIMRRAAWHTLAKGFVAECS